MTLDRLWGATTWRLSTRIRIDKFYLYNILLQEAFGATKGELAPEPMPQTAFLPYTRSRNGYFFAL